MGYVSQCQQCGQTDDHPKHIFGSLTGESAVYHHDCVPFHLREMTTNDERVAAIHQAQEERGLKGDELRAFIQAFDETPQDAPREEK